VLIDIVVPVGNPNCLGRHNRRNGMLVNQLAYAISEEDDERIKRFYLALQLDAVDQVDGYGDSFFAENIEEWILECSASLLVHEQAPVWKMVQVAGVTAVSAKTMPRRYPP